MRAYGLEPIEVELETSIEISDAYMYGSAHTPTKTSIRVFFKE